MTVYALSRFAVTIAVMVSAGWASTGCSPAPQMPLEEAPAAAIAKKYTIQYLSLAPELAPLDAAMRAYGAELQHKFDVQAAKITKQSPNLPPPRMNVDFVIATRTTDFVSASASGEIVLGDPNPQPLQASFVEYLPGARIVTLADLFADADAAVKLLSDEARRRLQAEGEVRLRAQNLAEAKLADALKTMREKAEKGTTPDATNFADFLIDGVDGKAIGITLRFHPDQVAALSDGAQQLEVPARVFYAQLKPEFRDAFAVDKEDVDAAAKAAAPENSPLETH